MVSLIKGKRSECHKDGRQLTAGWHSASVYPLPPRMPMTEDLAGEALGVWLAA